MKRCEWAEKEIYIDYHDTEWGVPQHDDGVLFEHLFLDMMQAGLSWALMLRKRDNFRAAFDGFDPVRIAAYDDRKIEHLMSDPGIIRNRQKIKAAISNAKAFLDVQKQFGSFDSFLWEFVGGRPIQNRCRKMEDIPTVSPEAEALSKELKRRGFKFVGPTTCYAYMQAVGMINDHTVDCFRYEDISKMT
jgi:DNA-3-methyladenine glycosylase I